MTDWTTVLVAVGPAAVTGLVGYLTARRNAAVALAGLTSENQRLREQYKEDHLRNRQTTYHDLLVAEARLQEVLRTYRGGQAVDPKQSERYDDLVKAGIGAMIFGTDQVRAGARLLLNLYAEIADQVTTYDFGTKLLEERDEDITSARIALTDAMRGDVAPQPRDSAS
jgi:hypothetical protein